VSFLVRSWKPILGVVIGAGAGAAYAHFVGCTTGGCPLTSNPLITAALGGLMGYSLVGAFSSPGKKDEEA
jgi:hypothetical protein